MAADQSNPQNGYSLLVFFVLAFGPSWPAEIPLAPQTRGLIAGRIPSSRHSLAVYGPLLAAIIVTGMTNGQEELKDLWERVFKWRAGAGRLSA